MKDWFRVSMSNFDLHSSRVLILPHVLLFSKFVVSYVYLCFFHCCIPRNTARCLASTLNIPDRVSSPYSCYPAVTGGHHYMSARCEQCAGGPALWPHTPARGSSKRSCPMSTPIGTCSTLSSCRNACVTSGSRCALSTLSTALYCKVPAIAVWICSKQNWSLSTDARVLRSQGHPATEKILPRESNSARGLVYFLHDSISLRLWYDFIRCAPRLCRIRIRLSSWLYVSWLQMTFRQISTNSCIKYSGRQLGV